MRLTVNDRVGLYLYEFRHIEADYEVPVSVTQSGIAQGVGMSVTHVPRAVNKLEDVGLVFTKSTYVKGSRRKKKTYHLTRDGIIKYRDLRESLGKLVIKVEDGSVAIADLHETLREQSKERCLPAPSFFELLSALGEGDAFDPQGYWEGLDRDGQGTARQTPIHPFVARSKETKALKKAVSSPGVVVVEGEDGSGKTSLVKNALSDAIFCPALEDRSQLSRSLDSGEGTVVVLDSDLRETDDGLLENLRWLVADMGAVVVLTARDEKVHHSLKRQLAGIAVERVVLGPLEREGVRQLAGEGIDEGELDSLIHLTKGNPRKILAALEVDVDDDDLEDHQKALLRLLKSD